MVISTPELDDTGALIDWMRDYADSELPELDLSAGILGQGPPRLAPVEVRVYNPSEGSRIRTTEQIFSALRRTEGAVDVRHDLDVGVPGIAIRVDDATAARYGLDRADVARSLYGQSFGLVAEQYRQEQEPIPLILRSGRGPA